MRASDHRRDRAPNDEEDHVTVILFPGIAEVAAETEPEILLDEIVLRQQILLGRWQARGAELKRRIDGMPFDLALELADLLRETAA